MWCWWPPSGQNSWTSTRPRWTASRADESCWTAATACPATSGVWPAGPIARSAAACRPGRRGVRTGPWVVRTGPWVVRTSPWGAWPAARGSSPPEWSRGFAEPVPVGRRGGRERPGEVLTERHRAAETTGAGDLVDAAGGVLQQHPSVVQPPREHPLARTGPGHLGEATREVAAAHV